MKQISMHLKKMDTDKNTDTDMDALTCKTNCDANY